MQQGMATASVGRQIVSAGTMMGNSVRNPQGDDLGNIHDIMLDLETGSIAYAVLSFGGFLGLGDKLFAVPFAALQYNSNNEFLLDVSKDKLKVAPGFEKDSWPNFADPAFEAQLHNHYQVQPYRERFQYARPLVPEGKAERDAEVRRERLDQPDLPQELRRRPIDVTSVPGSTRDADLKTADPARTYV